jgi:peptidoglycan/LPS O-acetylase OafA/YrhL
VSDIDTPGGNPEFRMMLRRVQIIHAAIGAGMLMLLAPMVVLRLFSDIGAAVTGSAATMLFAAVFAYACLVLLGDGLLTRWRIGRLRATPRERRVQMYLSLAIIRCALLESVIIAASAGWLFGQKDALLLVGLAALVYMLLVWPSQERVQRELDSAEEAG